MKKYRGLIYILSCLIIGFLFTFLVYIGLWERLIDGFHHVPIWLFVVLLPVVFYITLTLHELGHLIAFVLQGTKIRALYLTIFVFYKDEKGWHFTVKPKLWILFGGLVIPDLAVIKNESEMDKQISVFAKALIAAPIVTITWMIIIILSSLLTWLFGTGNMWLGILMVSMIYTVLLSALYIYTFGLNTKNLYGDFVAYDKMKNDEFFQFAEIYQYQSFSLSCDEDQSYLFHKAAALMKPLKKIEMNMFQMVTLMAYLEGVIHHKEKRSASIDFLLSKMSIHRFMKSEEGLMLIYMLAEYYYINGDVEKAYQMITQSKKHAGKRIPSAYKRYAINVIEHVTHFQYHDQFLANDEHIYIGQNWLFEAIIDPYETAKKAHEKLPFQVYECVIPQNEQKKPSED